ncbi:jg8767 [Pararge aegeria aegeria]|uniref:Jg8767 protein n=1 Tax=Pararge aegeria aegeria TaxID=348720 RepID=A0A8S4RY68_9NEOP|nr:jg8767 [Pararge aegeria aegeria]
MFASRLLLLLFCGYINADRSLHCDFDKLSLCDWRNDPQANNVWLVSFNSVANLKKFKDNFQIIIEAMATSYFGFANIDKVAILQRSECDAAISAATNPG